MKENICINKYELLASLKCVNRCMKQGGSQKMKTTFNPRCKDEQLINNYINLLDCLQVY